MTSADATLSGKTILITGAAERLGKQLALRLASAGADIAITHLNQDEQAAKVVQEIQETGGRAVAFRSDVTDPEASSQVIDGVQQAFGRLDVLVHNASSFVRRDFLDITPEDFAASFDVNVKGPLFLSQSAVPLMRKNGGGKIIALVGNSLFEAWPDYVTHAISKSALARLMQVLAVTLAPQIQCCAVCPGRVVATPNVHSPSRRPNEHVRDEFVTVKDGVTLHTGTADDVAELIKYISGSTPYLNGAIIPLDGGRSLC